MKSLYHISINDQPPHKVELKGDQLEVEGVSFKPDLVQTGPGAWHLIDKGRSYRVELLKLDRQEKQVHLRINGNTYRMTVKDNFDLLAEQMGFAGSGAGQLKELKAPMPGLVLDILASEGTVVSKGDRLAVLEAMKMENVLKAPGDGVVKTIHVSKRQAVEKNQVLITFS